METTPVQVLHTGGSIVYNYCQVKCLHLFLSIYVPWQGKKSQLNETNNKLSSLHPSGIDLPDKWQRQGDWLRGNARADHGVSGYNYSGCSLYASCGFFYRQCLSPAHNPLGGAAFRYPSNLMHLATNHGNYRTSI